MRDDLGNAADARGDDRTPHGERLQDGEPKHLVPDGGDHGETALTQVLVNLCPRLEARELYLAEPQVSRLLLQRAHLGSITDNHNLLASPKPQLAKRLEQHVSAFEAVKPARE